jgi:hypothetical protein
MNRLVNLHNKILSPLLEHTDNTEGDMADYEDNYEGDKDLGG